MRGAETTASSMGANLVNDMDGIVMSGRRPLIKGYFSVAR